MKRLALLLLGGGLLAIPAPAFAGTIVFDNPGSQDNDIGDLTLDFGVEPDGSFTLATTSSTSAPGPESWNSVAGTTSTNYAGADFELAISGNLRLQLDSDSRNVGVSGDGLGVQGQNQWRVDDEGAEIVSVAFGIDGGSPVSGFALRITEIGYVGATGTGTFVVGDADTTVNYSLPGGLAGGTLNVAGDGLRLSDGQSLTVAGLTGGGTIASLTFVLVPEPASVALVAVLACPALIQRRK